MDYYILFYLYCFNKCSCSSLVQGFISPQPHLIPGIFSPISFILSFETPALYKIVDVLELQLPVFCF